MADEQPIPRVSKRARPVGLMALAAGLLGATPLAAQTTGDNAAHAADPESVQDIVVTATKHTTKLSEVGGAISAISGDTLRDMNANTIQDYLGFVPGVSLTSYGRPGQTEISIRGISSQSVGPATAVYVDEIPFGQSSNESQGAAYAPDIDPSDLERVEVLKGPQGTLYGASSLGGLIKYVTRAPSLAHSSMEFGEELSSVDHGDLGYKIRASGTTPIITDVLGIRVSGYYRRDPGFIENVYTGEHDVNRGDAYGGRVSLLYKPVEHLTIKLGAMLQNDHAHGMNEVDYNVTATAPPPFVATYGDLKNARYIDQPSHVNNQVYSAEIHYDVGPADIVSATGVTRERIARVLDVTDEYGEFFGGLLGTTPGDGNTIALDAAYNVNKTTQELRIQSHDNGKFEWTVGGFYQDESSNDLSQGFVRNAAGVEAAAPIGNPVTTGSNNDLKEYAGFANATVYVFPNFDLSAGYRHSRIDQDNFKLTAGLLYGGTTTRTDIVHDNVNTYSFGARWRITPRFLAYARAASGFRPGGGRTLPPAGVAAGLSATYQPDRVWSYEAGVKASALDNRLAINVDAFWIDWKNIQNLQYIQGFFVQGNAGDARSRGVETDVQLEPVKGLNLTGSFAYTDAVYTQPNVAEGINAGDQLDAIAKYTASLRAEYEHPLNNGWRGFAGGDIQYRSSELDEVDYRMPAYTLFGLHAGVDNGHLRANLFVTNLTDKRAILGTTTGSASWAVVQPRTIGVSLSQNF